MGEVLEGVFGQLVIEVILTEGAKELGKLASGCSEDLSMRLKKCLDDCNRNECRGTTVPLPFTGPAL